MPLQYQNSPLPLTPEIIQRSNLLAIGNRAFYTPSFVFDFFAENGIIIGSILSYFMYRLIRCLIILKNEFAKNKCFYSFWMKGLFYTFLSLILALFYASSLLIIEFYFIVAITISTIYFYKKCKQNGETSV